MKKLFAAVAALCSLLVAAPAVAAPYVFDLTGAQTAHFTLDSDPAVNTFAGDNTVFWITNVAGVQKDVYFYIAANGGGIGFKNLTNSRFSLITDGPQLFTGPVTAPTFTLGTFALTSATGGLTLTISNPNAVAAVPEPATWAMMLLGFGAIGFAARRQRKTLQAA